MTNEMSNDQCPNPKEAPISMLQSLPRDECLGFGNCLELGPWALGISERGFPWSGRRGCAAEETTATRTKVHCWISTLLLTSTDLPPYAPSSRLATGVSVWRGGSNRAGAFDNSPIGGASWRRPRATGPPLPVAGGMTSALTQRICARLRPEAR